MVTEDEIEYVSKLMIIEFADHIEYGAQVARGLIN